MSKAHGRYNSLCKNCPKRPTFELEKLGDEVNHTDYVVALAGNPNTGKSTVFNALTGLRQHTGNWPGKTVTKAEGAFVFQGRKYKLVDLPGTYSLLSTSKDEDIARDFILFGNPDVTVVVVDANRLERNLNLVFQIMEITNRIVICLNLMDEAQKNNIEIDLNALSKKLGVPVVPTSARFNRGIPALLKTIDGLTTGVLSSAPKRIDKIPKNIRPAVEKLCVEIERQYPNVSHPRWLAFRLLAGDRHILDAIKNESLK